jgi:hypothetical protein
MGLWKGFFFFPPEKLMVEKNEIGKKVKIANKNIVNIILAAL